MGTRAWLLVALGVGGCCFGGLGGGGADLGGTYYAASSDVTCDYHLHPGMGFPDADVRCGDGPDSWGRATLTITDGATPTPQVSVSFEIATTSILCSGPATRVGSEGSESLTLTAIECSNQSVGCQYAPVMLMLQQTAPDAFSIQGGTFASGSCAGSSLPRASFQISRARRSR